MVEAHSPVARIRGAGVRYPSGRVGLHPLDLEIGPGEAVAILGPNGSGKSTLLRLLATDLAHSEGSLEILGRPVDRRSRRELRQRIGFCPDTPVHFPWLSGEENAHFFSALRGRIDDEHSTRLKGLFDAFELAEVRDAAVSEYSFGMKRKLLLLESLAPRLPLLLLDEPTVGLDPVGTRVLRDELRGCVSRGGAVVIGSNDVRELPLWADRIAFLHRGRLIEYASRDALVQRITGWTRIEIQLHAAAVPGDLRGEGFRHIPGLTESQRSPDHLVFQSSRGGEPLPALLATLLTAGARVRDVRVREPDFGDIFRAITGEPFASDVLGPEPSGGSG